MDKNQVLGLVVMAGFLVVYFYFFKPELPPPTEEQPKIENVQQTPEKQQEAVLADVNDSVRIKELQTTFGDFAAIMEGEEKTVSLENEVLKIDINTKGGIVSKALVKDYQDYNYGPLVLFNSESSSLKYSFNTKNGKIYLNDLFFQVVNDIKTGTDTTGVGLRAMINESAYIELQYLLPANGHSVVQKVKFEGFENTVLDENLYLNWDFKMLRQEHNIEDSRRYSAMNAYLANGEFINVQTASASLEEEQIDQKVNWLTLKQKFFLTGIITEVPFSKAHMSSLVKDETDTIVVRDAALSMDLPFFANGNNSNTFKFYYGPIKLKELKKVTKDFDKNLYTGWPVIKWFNKYFIIPIFNFLENHIGSYGLIIVILVFIIKLILSPLTFSSQKSMAKMKVMKPEIDEIKAKYPDDAQKVQTEQMALYRQVGVNPLSGCVPMLLQMPILFAMFQFIPHAIELRHESFLWATDLSTYDSILSLPFSLPGYGDHVSLFTLLMTLSTILYTWANSQMTAATMEGPMKTMQYFMPVIFMFVLNKFPAGLTFYYFVSNIASFGQMSIIKRMVDETKIRKILDENRLKNKDKKKSPFQARLEQAMKAREQGTGKQKKK